MHQNRIKSAFNDSLRVFKNIYILLRLLPLKDVNRGKSLIFFTSMQPFINIANDFCRTPNLIIML